MVVKWGRTVLDCKDFHTDTSISSTLLGRHTGLIIRRKVAFELTIRGLQCKRLIESNEEKQESFIERSIFSNQVILLRMSFHIVLC
jgi:hypothetical protein